MTRAEKRQERLAEITAEAVLVVSTGRCPQCGTPLIRNTSMYGWWQCGAYACEAFRAPEFRGLPECHFQCFTDQP